MLSADGSAKLADVGLAHRLVSTSHYTTLNVRCAKQAHMHAPAPMTMMAKHTSERADHEVKEHTVLLLTCKAAAADASTSEAF